MLPSTVAGLLVLVVAVLPGLVYTLAFERQAGDFGSTLADRTLRLIAASAVFHLVAAWPEYGAYRTILGGGEPHSPGEFGILWAGAIAMVALPAAAGTCLGLWYRRRGALSPRKQRLLRLVLGRDVAPRAWDDFFSERPTVYIRVRTTDGTLLGGLFASRSYAAGFPHHPDLLLEEAYAVDSKTGELREQLGYPLYISTFAVRRCRRRGPGG
jgi:hypothetical protein